MVFTRPTYRLIQIIIRGGTLACCFVSAHGLWPAPVDLPELEVVGGQIRFEVQAFVSRTRFNSVQGVGRTLSGRVDPRQGHFSVVADLRDFRTRNRQRDRDLHDRVLESAVHRTASFTGSIETYASETGRVALAGTLTLHGRTHALKIIGTLDRPGDQFRFRARFVVSLSAFGMQAPRNLFVLRVGDAVTVHVEVQLRAVKP